MTFVRPRSRRLSQNKETLTEAWPSLNSIDKASAVDKGQELPVRTRKGDKESQGSLRLPRHGNPFLTPWPSLLGQTEGPCRLHTVFLTLSPQASGLQDQGGTGEGGLPELMNFPLRCSPLPFPISLPPPKPSQPH